MADRLILEEILGETAFANLKANDTANWPVRSDAHNRVEPITLPGFTRHFQLDPGMPIFTIGSCFARNVELKLAELGFEIPSLAIRRFGQASPAVLNNYTAPSIYNEVNWALNPSAAFDPDTHFYSVGADKVVDLHLGGRWSHPIDREAALQRRVQVTEIYNKLPECRVLILTLGLVEAWYDTELGLYLNSPPMKSLLRSYPNRFVLRVLRHREVYDYLAKTMELVRKHAKTEIQCLLTVSPVPLQSTFRADTDVIVANTYSKATLRSVAEEICADFDFVHYFPSFESVTLSERGRAWQEDLVHVTREIVDINIARMIDAYLNEDAPIPTDPRLLLQRAQHNYDQGNIEDCMTLLPAVLEADPADQQALGLMARCQMRKRQFKEALATLVTSLPDGAASRLDIGEALEFDNLILYGRVLLRDGQLNDALEIARLCHTSRPQLLQPMLLIADVQIALQDTDGAIDTLTAAIETNARASLAYVKLSDIYQGLGNMESAMRYAKIASTINPNNPRFKKLVASLEEQLV